MLIGRGLQSEARSATFVVVLIAVCGLEVLLHGAPPAGQAAFAASQYAFIGLVALVEARLAILYFIGFTLVSLGAWTYVLPGADPQNFWGLRLGGVSVNAVSTIGLFGLTAMKRRLQIRRGVRSPAFVFLGGFFTYALLLGIVRLALGQIYLDNLAKDLAVFALFPLYWSLCSTLDRGDVARLVRVGITCGVVTMLFSYVVGEQFFYSENNSYLLLSSFGYLAVFAVFAIADLRRGRWAVPLALVMVALLTTGDVFLGAKSIAVLGVTMIWRLTGYGWGSLMIVGAITAGAWVAGAFAPATLEALPEGAQVTYKIEQVWALLNLGAWGIVVGTQTSVGNVLAEGWTLMSFWLDHPGYMLVGRGFGGGIPDVFGYLSPAAGAGGYAVVDAARDEFVRLHLPVYVIGVKSGILGTILYLWVVLRLLLSRNARAFLAAVLLATVFTNTKEMMLLTVLLLVWTAYDANVSGDGAPLFRYRLRAAERDR